MPRHINADALTKRIDDELCKPCRDEKQDYNGVRCRACQVDDMLILIDSEPTADVREVMASAWIPVTERLPEVYTMYLVTLDDGSVYFLYWEWDDDFKHWVDEEGNGDYIVTAWMPLPKSFKP